MTTRLEQIEARLVKLDCNDAGRDGWRARVTFNDCAPADVRDLLAMVKAVDAALPCWESPCYQPYGVEDGADRGCEECAFGTLRVALAPLLKEVLE